MAMRDKLAEAVQGRARDIIRRALRQRRGGLWLVPRTEMERALNDPDLPKTLTVSEFRELWDQEIEAELRKFK